MGVAMDGVKVETSDFLVTETLLRGNFSEAALLKLAELLKLTGQVLIEANQGGMRKVTVITRQRLKPERMAEVRQLLGEGVRT